MDQDSSPARADTDRQPCPVCGVTLHDESRGSIGGGMLSDSLLNTPLARLYALAVEVDVNVFDLPDDVGSDFAGAVASGYDSDGRMHGLVGLRKDLDDDLRCDVLAFGIAAYVGQPEQISKAPGEMLGIAPSRLPAARDGIGHLAWHMLRTCGRLTTSATFELMVPPDSVETGE